MPSNTKAQQIYEEARKTLNNVARSWKATRAQVQQARRARTRLTLEFIGENIQDVEQRTVQFKRSRRDRSVGVGRGALFSGSTPSRRW